MKLTALLTLVTCFQLQASSAFSQKISIAVKDAPLEKVIQEVGKQSGFAFLYDAGYLKSARPVTVKVKNVPLADALNSIFLNQSFTWDLSENVITITSKRNTELRSFFVDLKGKVVSSSGEALPGATVKIKNGSLTAVTNMNGEFDLKAVSGDAVLIISFTGYITREVAVNNQRQLTVVLEQNMQAIEEVAVVAYGTQKKESVVGAISTVRINDLKTPTRNLQNSLAGKVAGVISVQRSGEPGFDDAQFWVRGISTFGSGNTRPLVLVDGVERPINNIEPEEIETFSVLKDAAATSVYGVRAANGVILVTTRRGIQDKPAISFKLEQGMVGSTMMPQLADAGTYLTLYNEAQLASNPLFVTPYTPQIIAKHVSGEDPYLYPNVDWVGLLMKKWSNNSRANLNITGGSESAKYFVSATYYGEDGIYKDDYTRDYDTNISLKRYNFRANTDLTLSKTTTLSLGLGGILVTQNLPGAANSQTSPSSSIWSAGIMLNTPVGYAPTYPDPTGQQPFLYGGINGTRNPYQLLTGKGFITNWQNNIQSDITLKQDLGILTKGLKVQGKFAFDGLNFHNILRTRDLVDAYIATGRDPLTNELQLNMWQDGQDDLGYSRESFGSRRIYSQLDFTYNRTFGKHNIGGLLLYNQQNYQTADLSTTNAIAALPFRLQGFAARASYNYKSRYFTEFTAGYNGSENFAKGERFGFFPAVAAAWILSEEPFFKNNIGAIEYLKFRGSFGYKGNDQIGGRRFAYLTTLGTGNGSFAGDSGYKFGLDNNNVIAGRGEDEWGANLTWEREEEINLGIETRFLKGFYMQTDVFKRHRKGIFLNRQSLPYILGLQSNPWANLGEFENKGFETTLEFRKKLGGFDMSFRGNFTFARNKIINDDQAEPRFAYQDRRGKRTNGLYGLIADGLFTSEDEIRSSATQSFGTVRTGDIKYKDVNGDGVIDTFDEVNLGNPSTPEMVYGFGTTLAFKGFDLSVFFQGAGNMDFMLGSGSGAGWFPFETTGLRGNLNVNALDRWTPENPRQDALFPRLSFGTNTNNYRNSTWWLRNADYLRLKTAELGYTLPKRWTSKVKVSTLRFYVSGFNLLTFSKFDFWDPELGNGRGGAYPLQRTLNAGLNMNF